MSASTLYLDRKQTCRGHCQLVFDGRHVEGLECLATDRCRGATRPSELAQRAATLRQFILESSS